MRFKEYEFPLKNYFIKSSHLLVDLLKSKPWYLSPLMVLVWLFDRMFDIGLIKIKTPKLFLDLFPQKTFDFYAHMREIIVTLRSNGEEFWAKSIEEAWHKGRSGVEISLLTQRRLSCLLRDKVSKKLKLRKKIKIAINVFYRIINDQELK